MADVDDPPGESRASDAPVPEQYVLKLFITGMTPRSTHAIEVMTQVCETHLHGRYSLEIIDLYQRPELADAEQIIAVPTLVKKVPAPLRRLIGDLSDIDKVLVGLNIQTNKSS